MRTAAGLMMAVILSVLIAAAQSGSDLLQQALELERGKGDIDGATQLYQRISKDFSADRFLVATARFRLAHLQEFRGQDAEARKSYQEIIDSYSEQTDLAAAARSRLSGMSPAKPIIHVADLDTDSGLVRTPVSTFQSKAEASDRYPSWSPDGKSIAFLRTAPAASLRIGFPSTSTALTTSAVVHSLEAKEEKSYESGGSGARFWLPDGTGFYSLSLQGGLFAYLTNFAGGFTQTGNSVFAPSDATLSRDATKLYALLGAHVTGLTYMNWTIVVVDVANVTNRVQLTTHPDGISLPNGQPTTRHGFVGVSHDGTSLAMLLPDKDAGNKDKDIVRIVQHASTGKVERNLAIQLGFAQGIGWTADDRFLVYAASDDDSTWRIMRLAADGSGKPQFTGLEVHDLTHFDLSPDGKRIAFDGNAYTIRKDR